MKKKSSNNCVLYYACFHPDGTEKIVHGFAEARLLEAPWKRRGFSSAAEARDFLDNRKRTELARVNAELKARCEGLEQRIEDMEAAHRQTVSRMQAVITTLKGRIEKMKADEAPDGNKNRIEVNTCWRCGKEFAYKRRTDHRKVKTCPECVAAGFRYHPKLATKHYVEDTCKVCGDRFLKHRSDSTRCEACRKAKPSWKWTAHRAYYLKNGRRD